MLFSSKKCVFCPQKGLVNPTWVNHPFNKKKIFKKIFENSLGGFSSFSVSLHFSPSHKCSRPLSHKLPCHPPPQPATTKQHLRPPPISAAHHEGRTSTIRPISLNLTRFTLTNRRLPPAIRIAAADQFAPLPPLTDGRPPDSTKAEHRLRRATHISLSLVSSPPRSLALSTSEI
jgi:hypothetical protein